MFCPWRKPAFIKLFHLFNCCSRQQFTWCHIWAWRNSFLCNSFLGLRTPVHFHKHRSLTVLHSWITIRIWTISLSFFTLRNRERQKPNIQQRHKRTTGETAGATNYWIRPQISTSRMTGIRAIWFSSFYGSFDFFEFLFQMLRLWQLFSGKWSLCYWLPLFKETTWL
jgi:hypothetical protein